MNTMVKPGLEGVIAAETRMSRVNGHVGELIIGGFPLEELAGRAAFEETVYLLWHGTLPDKTELAQFRHALVERRALAPESLDLLRAAAAQQLPAMDALRMAAGTLNLVTPTADIKEQARLAVAAFPTIVAAYWRLRNRQTPLSPRSELAHAANYLYMLTGNIPGEEQIRAMETYLNTVVDHGLNASTFTARTIISTQSDMISAVTGGVGALKGPLHGGAPGPALDMVFEIGTAEKAEAYLRQKLDRGERLMGFGHRVYKVRDPRAEVLSHAAERLYQTDGDLALYRLARHVEQTAVKLLAEYKPGRNLQTNVEFYTALLLHGLGLPPDLFSPTFAVSRVAGWTAHGFEQQAAGRLIRPTALYVGETNRRWTPLEER